MFFFLCNLKEEDLICGCARRSTVITRHEVELLFLHRFVSLTYVFISYLIPRRCHGSVRTGLGCRRSWVQSPVRANQRVVCVADPLRIMGVRENAGWSKSE